jgi:hypothetical protein
MKVSASLYVFDFIFLYIGMKWIILIKITLLGFSMSVTFGSNQCNCLKSPSISTFFLKTFHIAINSS